jgi:hypothetical protein
LARIAGQRGGKVDTIHTGFLGNDNYAGSYRVGDSTSSSVFSLQFTGAGFAVADFEEQQESRRAVFARGHTHKEPAREPDKGGKGKEPDKGKA